MSVPTAGDVYVRITGRLVGRLLGEVVVECLRDHGRHESSLVSEVVVERGSGNAGARVDVPRRRVFHALLSHDVGGRLKDC
jgi:hypothetical protein